MSGRSRQPPPLDPIPEPPQWALDAGLPEPELGEHFCAYVTRLGLDAEPLLEGLTLKTEVLAKIRLAQRLADDMPDVWQQHLALFVKAHSRAGYLRRRTL